MGVFDYLIVDVVVGLFYYLTIVVVGILDFVVLNWGVLDWVVLFFESWSLSFVLLAGGDTILIDGVFIFVGCLAIGPTGYKNILFDGGVWIYTFDGLLENIDG